MVMDPEVRISIDAEIYHGKPCIKGTRIAVYLILEMIGHGLSFDEILQEYPHITIDDVKACVQFAKALVNNEEITPLVTNGIST